MADYQYLTDAGVIVPDTADTLGTVEGEFREALGAELNVDPATPQGRLIATEVSARDQFLRNNADLANQINPNKAGGTFLDAIWALTGGQRFAQRRSVVRNVQLGGVPGTIIPDSVLVKTNAGDSFQLITTVTLDGAGVGVGEFRSVEFGEIPAPANSFVFDPDYTVLGWETVANPDAAELGRLQESDVAARLRRRRTLALQGHGLPEAIVSRLYDLEGVRSLAFRENTGDATATIDGVMMISHSIFVCVDGGDDSEIAETIIKVKNGGCGYNGDTVVNYTDPASGQAYPVRFQRPANVGIYVRIEVRAGSVLSDPDTTIKQSLIDYANGNIEGEAGFMVGVAVSPFELGGAVNIQNPGVFVRKVEISRVGDPLGTDIVPITLYEVPRLAANNIVVVLV